MLCALRTRLTLQVRSIFTDGVQCWTFLTIVSFDLVILSDPNLQSAATMVSAGEIERALREDERERTVFGYLWLAVRKLVGQHIQCVVVSLTRRNVEHSIFSLLATAR